MTAPPLLALEGLHRRFDGGRIVALDGVSVSIAAGDCIAVTGRSGSGKSCLLDIAAGLDRPDAGRVLWQGREMTGRRAWAALRRESIGIVFQEFHLLPTLTALQNIELALMGRSLTQREQAERAAAALEEVGLAGRAGHLPTELSGGERQRVAIARAIARRPALLFADEPTGNLDSANSAQVAELLFRLQRERTMALVLVTHDPALAARCPRCLVLRDGRIAEERRP